MNLTDYKTKYLTEAKKHPLAKFSIKNRHGQIMAQSEQRSPFIFSDDEDTAWAQGKYQIKEKFKNGEGKLLTVYLMEPSATGLYRSADGKYYAESELPENEDSFITQLATQDVKNERNARISDTDEYAKLMDITVQPLAREKRRQLTEAERQELTAYRQQLRDMPSQTGFPFVEFPEFPTVLAYELQQKLDSRNQRKEGINA